MIVSAMLRTFIAGVTLDGDRFWRRLVGPRGRSGCFAAACG